jgi:hypothetical protein
VSSENYKPVGRITGVKDINYLKGGGNGKGEICP